MATDPPLRAQLNAVLDESPIGHHPRKIYAVVGRLNTELTEAQGRALGSWSVGSLTRAPVAERSRHDSGRERRSDLQTPSASPRLEGRWYLWGADAHGTANPSAAVIKNPMVVSDHCFDSASHLRSELNSILDSTERSQSASPPVHVVHRLMERVEEWEGALVGHTTMRTLTDAQIRLAHRDHHTAREAALRGDRKARQECVFRINEAEWTRTLEYGKPRTSSVWLSKVQPSDRELVITREAIDAVSYNQLCPAKHTRYASFDGADGPIRDAMLRRVLSSMHPESVVVVATDKSPEGRALHQSIERAAEQFPKLAFVSSPPALAFGSWQSQLRATTTLQRDGRSSIERSGGSHSERSRRAGPER